MHKRVKISRLQELLVLTILAMSLAAQSQRLPDMGYVTPAASLSRGAMISSASPCITRDEPFDMDAYNGPLSHIISGISQKVDRTTVHAPGHHTILRPCSLSTGEKFRLFVNDSVDPVNFFGIAWSAGESQLERDDRAFGQGAAGYSKRFAAGVADNATGDFFGMFLYPALFHQDPRYYRVGRGSVDSRIGHALAHSFVAVNDSGKRNFNYSEWFSTVSSKLVSNLYHPGNPRGFGPTASRVGFSVANDMAWDVLREFWPEITHKFRLPFRTQNDVPRNQAIPAAAPANNSADTAGAESTTH
jgi:hypothetical protein